MKTHISQSPVARSIPHEVIEGLEISGDVQAALERIFNIFRNIQKEPTGMVNKFNDSTLTFSDIGLSVSIAPKAPATSFEYVIRGKSYYVTTTLTAVISPTANEGLWFFYFNESGNFVTSQTPWDIMGSVVPVATGYWDSTNAKWIANNEERHGARMDGDTHYNLHKTDGAKIEITQGALSIQNFIINGDGSLNTHAQYGITDGIYFDEDLPISIKHANTPTNNFEQYLAPYAKIPIFYLTGTGDWRKKNATDYPIYENPPNTAYYNRLNAGTWSAFPCTNGYFFATWLIYTDDLNEPVISLLGQREDSDLISAINNNLRSSLIIPRRFSEEFYFYRKLIWQTSTSFTNTPKARLMYIAAGSETTPASDRYAAICSYNGNAGSGKFLEFYPGQSSDTSPFPIPEPSYIRTITLSTVSNSTGTVAFYKSTDLVNPIYQISLSGAMYTKATLTLQLNADDKIVAKVSSGSFNKPAITLFIQTSL